MEMLRVGIAFVCVARAATATNCIGDVCNVDSADQTVALQISGITQMNEETSSPYKFQDRGSHAVCAESGRIKAECGNCGPYWGNLEKCQNMCDSHRECSFITFYSDSGCRLYRSCDSTYNQNYGWGRVITSIYKRTPPTEFTYDQVLEDRGDHAVCNEDARVPAYCGNCGPHWGDLLRCKDMCSSTESCNFITFYNDNGCRMYSSCTYTFNQNYGFGRVLTSIHKKKVKASRPRPRPTPTPPPTRAIPKKCSSTCAGIADGDNWKKPCKKVKCWGCKQCEQYQ